jgi:hypothetical protein
MYLLVLLQDLLELTLLGVRVKSRRVIINLKLKTLTKGGAGKKIV